MARYSQEELIALGQKVVVNKERDKKRARAKTEAIMKLIAAHEDEYDKYLKEAMSGLGL